MQRTTVESSPDPEWQKIGADSCSCEGREAGSDTRACTHRTAHMRLGCAAGAKRSAVAHLCERLEGVDDEASVWLRPTDVAHAGAVRDRRQRAQVRAFGSEAHHLCQAKNAACWRAAVSAGACSGNKDEGDCAPCAFTWCASRFAT